MKAIVGAVIVMMAFVSGANSVMAAQCTPFGDSPAKVNHGWFASFLSRHTPLCRRGIVLGPWKDPSGQNRYACLYVPAYAGKENPLPLIVFLHGSVATADSVSFTGLSDLVGKADLGGVRPGFILLAPQGRYTSHFYPGFDSDAFGWDNWYRQLSPSGAVTVDGTTYPENADAASIDHFVSEQLATGEVDSRRIYMMGWSNGAAMAILYALNRPSIAAAAVYSAPDPFGAFFDVCPQIPIAGIASGIGQLHVFNPRVPVMHVRNACDIGGICPNGTRLAVRLRAMGGNVEDIILDASRKTVASCDDNCGIDPMGDGQVSEIAALQGFWHHARWPTAWNDKMLSFLKQHPIESTPVPQGAVMPRPPAK